MAVAPVLKSANHPRRLRVGTLEKRVKIGLGLKLRAGEERSSSNRDRVPVVLVIKYRRIKQYGEKHKLTENEPWGEVTL